MSTNRNKISAKSIAIMAVLGALSIVLLLTVRFSLFLPFLEYDCADVPIVICTMMFGAGYGLILTLVVCLIQGFLLSSSGIIGVLMHILATGSFVLVFGLLRRKNKSVKWTIVSALIGVATWVVVMILFNLILTPVFMGLTTKEILPFILPSILPFNLIKSASNVGMGIVLYYSLNKLVKLDKFTNNTK